ncbi:MAG: hypothetical protein Q9M22_05940 [Mariprofundaceae bacterium]|nr:hypothetical protein [Mariprofundaceae bacterium]
MNETVKGRWRPSQGDWVFMAVVGVVIVALILGSSERKTKATPDNATHQTATSRAACMACHNTNGVRPQPAGHVKADQCFQCHSQPDSWKKL